MEAIHNHEKSQQEFSSARKQLEMELDAAGKLLNQLTLQLAGYKDAVFDVEKKTSDIRSELAETQRLLRDAEVRESSMKQESSFLKQSVGQKSVELSSAVEDLLLMTRENQALTSELAHLSHEKEQSRAKIGELMQTLSSQQQLKVALEVEREDLLDTYRKVVQEKRRLDADMKKMGVAIQEGMLREKRMDDDLAVLKGQVDAYRTAERRWLGDRAGLSAQIEALNDSV
jgi:chromosome segregation ATPase